MNIETNTEIIVEFSKLNIEDMIKKYAEGQGYEVIKMVFKTETKWNNVSHQEMLQGYGGGSTIEFAGVKVYLKKVSE